MNDDSSQFDSNTGPRARGRRFNRTTAAAFLMVLLIGGFSLFFQLGTSKSLGSHEGYAIIPAREMLRSGDFIVPRFGEIPRLRKPPLAYWTIDASAWATGRLDIFSARLPASLAALGLGALMAWWAWRWYGSIAAIGAMAAQTTSVYVLSYGRKAEIDMVLILLIAAALCLVANHRAEESRRATFWRWAGVWACVSISWLGKFHFAPTMILAPAVAWIIFERRFRLLWGLLNPLGLLMFAAAVLVWPALVLQRLPDAWSIWTNETIGRALGELGRQPIWYYLPHLVTWTLPWTPIVFLAWPASWKRAWMPQRPVSSVPNSLVQRIDVNWRRIVEQGCPRERFLWIWLGVALAIVTVSASKHPHYILPALPAFALWAGFRFEQCAAWYRAGRRLVPRGVAIGVTALTCWALALLSAQEDLIPDLPDQVIQLVAAIGGGSVIAVCWLSWGRRPIAAGAVAGLGWVIAYGITTDILIPAQDHRLAAYQFGIDARAERGSHHSIGIHAIDKDAILWYIGEPAFRTETPTQVAGRLARHRTLWLITQARTVRTIGHLGHVDIVDTFEDVPGLPKVELGHYRNLVLIRLSRPARVAQNDADSGHR